ncbi:MAG: helix-turn-helix transcriptional regulator [Magnetococcus sp. YQC-3]
MGIYERNKSVAALRGEGWRSNLVKGKMESQFFPSTIKIIRVKKLMSQQDVARQLGISVASLGGIERGTRPAKLKIAERISEILQTPRSRLFKEKNKKLFAITPKG